jgi:hypothetical protein
MFSKKVCACGNGWCSPEFRKDYFYADSFIRVPDESRSHWLQIFGYGKESIDEKKDLRTWIGHFLDVDIFVDRLCWDPLSNISVVHGLQEITKTAFRKMSLSFVKSPSPKASRNEIENS